MLTSSAVFALLVFIHDLRLGCDANLIFKDPLKPKTEDEIKDPIVGDGSLRKSPDLNPDILTEYQFYRSSNDAVVMVGTSESGLQIMHEILLILGAAARVAFGYGYIHNDIVHKKITLNGIGNELDVAAEQKAVFRLSLLNEFSDNASMEFFFDSVFKVPDNSWSASDIDKPFRQNPLFPFIIYPATVPHLAFDITQKKGIIFKASTLNKEKGTGELPDFGDVTFRDIMSDEMTDADKKMHYELKLTQKQKYDRGAAKFLLGIGVQEQEENPMFVGIFFDGMTIRHQFEDFQQDITEPMDVWMEYEIQHDYIEIKFYSTLIERLGTKAIVQKLTYSSKTKPVRIFAHLGGISIKSESLKPNLPQSKSSTSIITTAAGVVIVVFALVVLAIVGYFCFFKKEKNDGTRIYDHRMGFELEKTGKDTDANTVLEASSYMDH